MLAFLLAPLKFCEKYILLFRYLEKLFDSSPGTTSLTIRTDEQRLDRRMVGYVVEAFADVGEKAARPPVPLGGRHPHLLHDYRKHKTANPVGGECVNSQASHPTPTRCIHDEMAAGPSPNINSR